MDTEKAVGWALIMNKVSFVKSDIRLKVISFYNSISFSKIERDKLDKG